MMHLTLVSLSLFSLAANAASQPCLTVAGKLEGKHCQFPFFHENTWSDGCKEMTKKPGSFWCSTRVDKNGSHVQGEWGVCGEGCRKHGDIIEGDTACADTKMCMSRYQCPLYQTLLTINDRSNEDYKTMVAKLKQNVCNRKEKRLCCHNMTQPNADDTTAEPSNITESVIVTDDVIEDATSVTEPAVTDHASLENTTKSSQFPAACVPIQDGQSFMGSSLPGKGSCGVKCNRLATVIGGEDAELGEFPWAVLLGYAIKKRSYDPITEQMVVRRTIGWKCGATLINSWYVLSAAHCLVGKKKKQLKKVRLGELLVGTDPDCPNMDKRGESLVGCLPRAQDHDVDQVIVHESYTKNFDDSDGKPRGIFFDIALIRMKTEAVLNQAVQLACLPVDMSEWAATIGASDLGDDLVGRAATVIGWGKVSNYEAGDLHDLGVSERHLQKVHVPVVSHQQCSQRFGEQGVQVTGDHICAGGQAGEDSCNGDSGGGLFIQSNVATRVDTIRSFVQIGVVSYGSKFCGGSIPGVYTRITQYIQWIQNKLKP